MSRGPSARQPNTMGSSSVGVNCSGKRSVLFVHVAEGEELCVWLRLSCNEARYPVAKEEEGGQQQCY